MYSRSKTSTTTRSLRVFFTNFQGTDTGVDPDKYYIDFSKRYDKKNYRYMNDV